jgi:hypothetical protein
MHCLAKGVFIIRNARTASRAGSGQGPRDFFERRTVATRARTSGEGLA